MHYTLKHHTLVISLVNFAIVRNCIDAHYNSHPKIRSSLKRWEIIQTDDTYDL